MCPRTSQFPWRPCFSRRLVPFAATILHHSRLPPLVFLGHYSYKSVQVIPALFLPFFFCKMDSDISDKLYKCCNNSITMKMADFRKYPTYFYPARRQRKIICINLASERVSIFSIMLSRCFSTVLSVIPSSMAMHLLGTPSTTRSRTSCSRGVS
jgi:hypothetical protein